MKVIIYELKQNPKQEPFIISRFCRLEKSGRLGWIYCLGSHKVEIKMPAGLRFFLEALVKLIQEGWVIHFSVVIGLIPASCWPSAGATLTSERPLLLQNQ